MAETGPEFVPGKTETLNQAVRNAETGVAAEMGSAPEDAARSVGKLGMMAELHAMSRELGDLGMKTAKDMLYVKWKDVKASLAAALSLIPAVGTVANVGKAVSTGKELSAAQKALKLAPVKATSAINPDIATDIMATAIKNKDTARKAFIESLKAFHHHSRPGTWESVGTVRKAYGEAGKSRKILQTAIRGSLQDSAAPVLEAKAKYQAAQTAVKTAAKVGAKNIGLNYAENTMHAAEVEGHRESTGTFSKVLKELDPFPEVPAPVAVGAGVAEFVIPGANLVPALWQGVKNRTQEAKIAAGTFKEAKNIIKRHLGRDVDNLRRPEVRQAANVFVPQAA
ncbi:hypothetical protein A2Z33_03595 [Candidatus Gottesmanbacteria bacterium RBG_16_52_11]|uniref:Uncharacterized protein n=1 Tax=Candidatus Gottesmanbacteria bacterium RBG_16_52_11 TaxID=1798374 RepID=A0A1F5YVH0_9BACT|nr:MAG: hypothetical protein A2Z33_03595 [Candidatus Gottesmanbacteria bacterium RBG_16_52_11]